MRIIIEDDNDDNVIELLDDDNVMEQLNDRNVEVKCNFNVSDNIIDVAYDEEIKTEEEYENNEQQDEIKGKITVYSRLGDPKGPLISSDKINLYMLNGISPRLVSSKLTDSDGKAIFEDLEAGSYRVISIVDRKYFEKPTYINWNEVTIDSNLYEETITVINRIKNGIYKG